MSKNKTNDDFLRPLKTSSQPLYLMAREYILNNILAGNWKPGEQLPPDQFLAKELGINHITLGKALNLLRDEGYLVRNRGRGTFVSEKLPEPEKVAGAKIAVVFDCANEDTFIAQLFLAIHNALEKYHLRMEFISSRSSSEVQLQQLLNLLKDKTISGCILWSLLDPVQSKEFMAARSPLFPVVLLDHQINGFKIDFSGYDDYNSGKLLGRHIRSQGFTRCSLCYREKNAAYSTNRQRLEGLRSTPGLDIEIFTDYVWEQPEKLVNYVYRMSQRKSTPAAIVSVSDADAGILVDSMKQSDWSDNIRMFTFCTKGENFPGIKMPAAAMGKNAVEIIHARLRGDNSAVIEKRETGTINIPEQG